MGPADKPGVTASESTLDPAIDAPAGNGDQADAGIAAAHAAEPAPREAQDHRRSAGIVGLAVMASRLMGLVRELVFPAMFGAGKVLDAYLAAFQIPNLLRDLFAEGSLSTAFTALFTRIWDKEGDAPAWQLANLTVSAMIFILGIVCVAAIIGAPAIVEVTNFGFHNVPGKFELAVSLTRVMFPFILFVSLAAAVMGMLNSRFIFGIPASASTVFNIVSVIAGVGCAFLFDPGARATWPHPQFGIASMYGVCVGVLLGGLAQLGMQLPALFKLGYRFHWKLNLRDPRLIELWTLMWPSVIAGSLTQVNVLVNGAFASEINGGRTWLACAFRLMYLPIGLFGVSLATVTLPAVARSYARQELGPFGQTVKSSLRLTLFLSIPAAVGLMVLANPVIALIYQHGRFTAHDTAMTALALQAYAIGLAGYAAIRLLTPCFYALDLPRTPMRIVMIGIGVNLVLNFLNMTVFHLGHAGLALATSAVCVINVSQLAFALSRRVDFGGVADWAGYLARVLLAALLCGAAAFGLWWVVDTHVHGFVLRALGLLAAIGGAVAIYAGAGYALRIGETQEAVALFRRRLLRRRAAKA
ncbi:MAG TPA: murein biosynthesis integral membrane protein MurJ [Caulobacteraceae bacterium]|nr:murein biosynthesis integral membrane protein MurJ [Caulobacteraceae bacterium]